MPKTAGAQPSLGEKSKSAGHVPVELQRFADPRNVELLRQSFEQMTFMRLLDFVPAQCKEPVFRTALFGGPKRLTAPTEV